MNLSDILNKRRMVRNFTDEDVADDVIRRILTVAQRGPSAGFTQGQDFIVVRDAQVKQVIADLCHEDSYVESGFDPFISKASVLIIPCTNEDAYHKRYQQANKMNEKGNEINWPVPYWFMDVGHAVMLLLLAVVDEGLAAGFAGSHDLDALRNLLNIPASVTPVGVIPIGHPADDKRSLSLKRERRNPDDYIHVGEW